MRDTSLYLYICGFFGYTLCSQIRNIRTFKGICLNADAFKKKNGAKKGWRILRHAVRVREFRHMRLATYLLKKKTRVRKEKK